MSLSARYERLIPVAPWSTTVRRGNPIVLGGIDMPDEESQYGHDWAIYCRPVQPEAWWPTVLDCSTQAMRFCPWKVRVNDNVGDPSLYPVPFFGCAIHVAAAQHRIELVMDEPYTFNMEVPPPSFAGQNFALWARPGRPSVRVQPLGHFQQTAIAPGEANIPLMAPVPAFATRLLGGANISGLLMGLRDRTGQNLYTGQTTSVNQFLDWRAAYVYRSSGDPYSISCEVFQ